MAQLIKGKQIKSQSVTINGSSGNVVALGDLDMSGYNVVITEQPTLDTQAANKAYVDAVAQGLKPHAPVVVVSTVQVTPLTGEGQVIDDVTVVHGDRVLLSNQGNTGSGDSHIDNGVWEVNSGGTWFRPDDMDGTPINELSLGDFVFVESGVTNISSGWVLSGTDANDDGNIEPGVEQQQWVKVSAPGSYTTDGEGIILTGNVFALELDGTTLTKTSSGLKVADSVITRISTNEDDVSSLETRVSTEESVSSSADVSLTTRLSTEESVSASADVSLTTRLSTEESVSASADVSLTTRISNEESTRTSADASLTVVDTSLETRISNEESTRTSADASLEDLISSGTTDITSLETRVSTEESTRTSADASLTVVDTSLETRISNEESSRTSADVSLDTKISTEVSTEILARVSADTSLEDLINNLGKTEFYENDIVPSASGTSLIIGTGLNFTTTGETINEESIVVYLNGLQYKFEYTNAAGVIFHTNGVTPTSTGLDIYFDGTASGAGFIIETDDIVKIKYSTNKI